MAGSIALSLTQRYDKTTHQPLDGGKLYFSAAGTTTPQNAFQDINLTIPWPNPITLDSGGNIPQLFFADGYVKFRLANAAGVTQIDADFVLVMGPTDGGGGGAPSVDPTTIMATGDMKLRHGTGALAGFVRANGRTIGSATSGASERANTDAQALFEYLWGADPNLAVSTGRGATANADWVAGKTIALPDFRGRVPAGLDDMGNSAAGRLTSSYFGASGTTLGVGAGGESTLLAAANIPSLTSVNSAQPISVTVATPSSRQLAALTSGTENVSFTSAGSGPNISPAGTANGQWSGISSISGTTNNNISVAYTNGSLAAARTVQPTILLTFYMKL